MSKFLDVALGAARAAEKLTLKYFSSRPRVQIKSDGTPVTIADRSAEKLIIALLKNAFPDHGFYGEETGKTSVDRQYIWLIDPIDGTKNFIRGIPLWGNLIALMREGEVILGLSQLPALGEWLWAEKGKGAHLNGKRVRVSKIDRLNHAMVSHGSLSAFRERRLDKKMIQLAYDCERQRMFGDLWPYHLLAAGKVDIVLEAKIKPMDVAPFDCIIREAGGTSTNLFGKPFDLKTESFLATNGSLHDKCLEYFRRQPRKG